MDVILNDPEIARKIVALLGHELQKAKTTVHQLQAGREPCESETEVGKKSEVNPGSRQKMPQTTNCDRTAIEYSINVDEVNKTLETTIQELELMNQLLKEKIDILEKYTSTSEESNTDAIPHQKETEDYGNELLETLKQIIVIPAPVIRTDSDTVEWPGRASNSEERDEIHAAHDAYIQELEEKVENLEAQNAELTASKTQVSRVTTDLNINAEFQQFMKALPDPPELPDYKTLSPVYSDRSCSKPIFKQHLELTHEPDGYRSDFLFFSRGQLRWMNHHILVFGPLFAFKKGQWKDEIAFSLLHGRTMDLFYSAPKGVHYSGTFRCHHGRHWFPEGCQISGKLCAQDIAEAQEVEGTALRPWQLSKLYKDGVLKADCLVLECVGFNHVLYDRLLQDQAQDQTPE